MKWNRGWVLAFVLSASSFAKPAVLQSFEVTGTDNAELKFQLEGTPSGAPSWQIRDGAIEVSFASTELSQPLAAQADVTNPHALVSRVRLFPGRDGSLKAKVTLNGSEQKLKERVQLRASGNSALLTIAYPPSQDATLNLLKDEQQPVFSEEKAKKSESGGLGWLRSVVLVFVLGAAGVGAFFAAKLMKKQVQRFGSRKYLIETIAYTPVGPAGKSGVGIVKVGSEFVLVGVTANHVSLLSQLPKLQAQYEEETQHERESFQEAVKEQVRELGRNGRPGRNV